jgi:hypothetical protein
VTKKRTLLALTALLVSVAPTAVAATSKSVSKHFAFVAERTTAGPTSFSMDFSGRWRRGSGAFFGDLGVHQDRGVIRSMQPDGMTSFGYADNDTVTYRGQPTSICTPMTAIACAGEGSGGIAIVNVSYSDAGAGADVANRWIFVMSGAEITERFHATGWRLRQVSLNFRYLDGAKTDQVGANLAGKSVGVATEASLLGGRYGSLAEAVPPCSNSETAPLMEGVGRLTLDGGTQKQTITCPGLPQGAIGSWSQAPTTWTAHGLAAGGSTLYNTRLLVIDLPESRRLA